ncbi:hypothetical protein BpHYR1_028094 [Brachionus plicatilis]|uniref:Uncharacterized protein n=1 Tax=Brachionus plicatilis TaxID=10195 RepID=A0A3M7P2F7_BRAPC|nr:hypothetical protein BpHYR1_028094 [Brachionus plicatilis]
MVLKIQKNVQIKKLGQPFSRHALKYSSTSNMYSTHYEKFLSWAIPLESVYASYCSVLNCLD